MYADDARDNFFSFMVPFADDDFGIKVEEQSE